MFTKMCVLQELSPMGEWIDVNHGELQVYYDSELYGSKMSFVDEEGAILSNSVIGVNTVMKLEGNVCSWRTVELASQEAYWRNLRAVFDNEMSAQQLHYTYLEGISYAQDWEIFDDLPGPEIEEIE